MTGAQWFHSQFPQHVCHYRKTGRDERRITWAFHVTRGLPQRDGAAGRHQSHTHTEQLQINSFQQQPLSSPAATRSTSTRNQPANSFRSELWGQRWRMGGGVGVWRLHVVIVLCKWQVCLDPVSDANITPPTLPPGSRQQTGLLPRTWKYMPRRQGYSDVTGLFIWLNTHCVQHNIDFPHVWIKDILPNTVQHQVYIWLFLVEYT